MCGSREWYLGVVSFRAWRALILWYASTNIRLTATAAFIHCVYVCQYEGMRDPDRYSSRPIQGVHAQTSCPSPWFRKPCHTPLSKSRSPFS